MNLTVTMGFIMENDYLEGTGSGRRTGESGKLLAKLIASMYSIDIDMSARCLLNYKELQQILLLTLPSQHLLGDSQDRLFYAGA